MYLYNTHMVYWPREQPVAGKKVVRPTPYIKDPFIKQGEPGIRQDRDRETKRGERNSPWA